MAVCHPEGHWMYQASLITTSTVRCETSFVANDVLFCVKNDFVKDEENKLANI